MIVSMQELRTPHSKAVWRSNELLGCWQRHKLQSLKHQGLQGPNDAVRSSAATLTGSCTDLNTPHKHISGYSVCQGGAKTLETSQWQHCETFLRESIVSEIDKVHWPKVMLN